MTLLKEAITWHQAGYTPLPTKTDGSKSPGVATWRELQRRRPTLPEVIDLFNVDHDGIGLLCGEVSGNLEMLELEGRAVTDGLLEKLSQAFADHDLTQLWERVNSSYAEVTPSGGVHWYYRVDGQPARNTKLARRPSTPEELAANPDAKVQVLIETRGEGGFTVIAPSGGRTHSSGEAWRIAHGTPADIPTITEDERDALFAIASTLDQMPAVEIPQATSNGSLTSLAGGLRPGDDFNARATWKDILEPHGWKMIRHFGGNTYGWQRPGKRHPGLSATTGRNDADNLYIFSTATEHDEEKPHSKFSMYAALEHGGDYTAAAKALRSSGYGAPPPEPSRPVHQTEGALATVSELPDPKQRPIAVVAERTLERSDDGNALQLIDRFGELIRYVPEMGRWIVWDGSRWEWCPGNGGIVREYAKRIGRSLEEIDTPSQTHKKKSLSAVGTTAMITQAETDDRVATRLAQLDSDPYALNTPDGPVDLRTGSIGTPDAALMHTRITSVTPDQTLPIQRWLAFLRDTFEGAPELQPFIQRLAGYSATGNVTHHILPFLHGPGGNGKSVFLDVVRAILGDYATTAPGRFLMAGQQQHETEIARLSGVRMVICSEVNQSDKFDEAKVKLLTGGDTLTARFMRKDHFDFQPTHHLWLMGNHQPKVSGGGESFWRRLRMLKFANIVPDEKKIDDLASILIREEGPGILAWIVEGARAVLSSGLQAPESVLVATQAYADEEDTLARFISERCLIGGAPHVTTATSALRGKYEQWCQQEGETALSPQVFGRELRTRFEIEQSRSHGKRFYIGITVLDDDSDDPAQEWFK